MSHNPRLTTSKGSVTVMLIRYIRDEELAEDDILVKDIVFGISTAKVLEDYPDFGKSPCCLVLQRDEDTNPITCGMGIVRGYRKASSLDHCI